MKKREIPGINIQWPWSELLINGKKTIETRSYSLPDKYYGVELAVIETPGPHGKAEANILKARIIGTITFDRCFQYESKTHWLSDFSKHLVLPNDDLYKFDPQKEKWGWRVKSVRKFKAYKEAPKRKGIVFTNQCYI